MFQKLWRIGEKEVEYISEAIESGLHGEFNQRLEEAFAQKFGVNFAIGVNSGNSALHCTLFALGVKENDEVIVPSLTFASPAFAPLYLGAIPVFADVDPETFTINPEDIERKITPKTKAIIAVALYGLPSNMPEIMKIAKKYKIKVIEDNAQCYLGKINGRLAGTFGDMAIFSFERSKHMTTGNGGIIITNDEKLAERARKFSILGYSTLTAKQASYKVDMDKVQHPDFVRHMMIGYNYRLPEIVAAMALAQLGKLDKFVKMRQKIADLYSAAVKGCDFLMSQKVPKGLVNSYWTYAMKLDTDRVSWEEFRKVFRKKGGERYYAAWKPAYLEPCLKNKKFNGHDVGYKEGLCPIAEDLQCKLIQLKTNFGDLDCARSQALILRETINRINSR